MYPYNAASWSILEGGRWRQNRHFWTGLGVDLDWTWSPLAAVRIELDFDLICLDLGFIFVRLGLDFSDLD